MSLSETLRLAVLGLLILLVQLALTLGLPGWRTGFEFYALFLMLLAARRGPVLAGIYALAGGAIMDSYTDQFIVFHILFYLVPVALGSLVRAYVLSEFRMLGTIATISLLLLKIAAMLLVAWVARWIPSPVFLFKVNYIPVLAVAGLVYWTWPWIIRVMGEAEVRQIGR
jgi:hypothetical protein